VQRTRALTRRPFGVNLVLEWDQHDRLAACLAAGARIVSLFWGNPAGYVDEIHEGGGLAVHTVGSAPEARRMVDAGVDVVVAQGAEAGGHVWGDVATMPLVPAVVDAVGSDVPVLAAGGIADGRGLAAALVLGAAGAWIGTRFIAAQESDASDDYKRAVVGGTSGDAVLTSTFDVEWPNAKHRVLRNDALRAAEQDPSTHRSGMLPTRAYPVELETAALYAGQSTGLVHDVKPAGEIVREIVDGARAALHAVNDSTGAD
jgi:NAD(P)H-dependent flavin oxidoreductase YrpB (nitropropane dioxygenase family)